METIPGPAARPWHFYEEFKDPVLTRKTLTTVVALCFVAVVVTSIEAVNAAALVVYDEEDADGSPVIRDP